ncbi:hypothetical protein SCAR479_05494 [Seiridium cardinale]|uniref:Uncharacterized protein n=1 Tax=Seiridium cardinale TaxID=138064 RepID=A0ABR2XVG9_9PEZI
MVGDLSRAYLTPGSRAQAIPKSQWTVQMSKTVYYHHHTLSVLFRQYRKLQIRSVNPPYMITKAEEHRLMRCVYIMEVLRLLLPTELRDDQAPGSPLSMFWMQLSPWENACVHWCTEHIAEATLLNRGTRQHLEALTETERIQGTRTLLLGCASITHRNPELTRVSRKLHPCGLKGTLRIDDVKRVIERYPESDTGAPALWFLRLIVRNGDSWAFSSSGFQVPKNLDDLVHYTPIWGMKRLKQKTEDTLLIIPQMAQAAASAGVELA